MFGISRRGLFKNWRELTQFTGDSYLQSMMGHGLKASTNSELIDKLVGRGFLQLPYNHMLEIVKSVDRAKFVPPSVQSESVYSNIPHKLSKTHAMSTPQFHAQIFSLLSSRLGPGRRSAEIGCGSGYIPALMRSVGCEQVFAVEQDTALLDMAKKNLKDHANVKVVKELPQGSKLDALYISPFFSSYNDLVTFVGRFDMAEDAVVVAAIVDPANAPDQQLILLEWKGNDWFRTDLFRVLCEPLV